VLAGEVTARALQASSKATAHDWKFLVSSMAALGAFGGVVAILRKPWTAEKFLPRTIIALFFLQIGMVCAMWLEKLVGRSSGVISISQMLVNFVAFQGAALLLADRFLKDHALRWAEAFGLMNGWQRALLWGLIAGALFFQIGQLLQALSAKLMMHLPVPVKAEEQPAVQTLRLASSWIDRIVLGAGTIVLVPFAEETLFRGILYTALKGIGFPRVALWITSLLFAAIHFNVAIFLPLLVLALVLTLLYEYTGNLLAPIAAHATFNAINFITLYRLQSQT
jgi:membrane protease YdiL (CAAX protease family)